MPIKAYASAIGKGVQPCRLEAGRQIPTQPQVRGERLQQTELARQGHSHGGHRNWRPGDKKERSGVATFLGSHCVKTQRYLQSTGSLSSGEAEYYGIVKAMAMVGTLARGAVQEGVEVFSDSSAARAFAQRKGLGRQKHVHVRWLWVQDKVLAKEATVEALNTAVNVADALTKPVASTMMNRRLKSMGFDFRQSWSTLHRRPKAS
eukprot:2303860-Amphidinium_carterae.1